MGVTVVKSGADYHSDLCEFTSLSRGESLQANTAAAELFNRRPTSARVLLFGPVQSEYDYFFTRYRVILGPVVKMSHVSSL